MTLHIVMFIVKLNRKIMAAVLAPIYSAYLFFLYQNFNLSWINKDFVKVDGYWHFIRTDPGFVMLSYMTVYGLILIISIVLLIYWLKKTEFLREKRQAQVLLWSLVLLFTFTFIDYVIFFFTQNDLGLFVHYVCVWPAGIGISIIKYRFLSVPPGLYSHDIFENIEESVLVFDHNKKILFANTNAEKEIIGKSGINTEGKFIRGFDCITEIADKLLKGSINNCVENITSVSKDKSKSAFQVKFSVIKDKYNDRIGVLAIAQQLKGVKEFIAEHSITYRELDVIKNAATGLSNREIAGKLNISERTVEAHLVNIYNKLDIKNKIELINIFKRYGLA